MTNLKWTMVAALVGMLAGFYLTRPTAPASLADKTQPNPSKAEAASPLPPLAASPPLVIVRPQELLTSDPNDPEYDPSMLLRVNQADASELFELEMRAEDWAPDFEEFLQEHIQRSLAELFVEIPLEVECKVATCKVSVNTEDLDAAKREAISDYLSYIAPIGPMTQTGTEGSTPTALVIFSALPPEQRTYDGFSTFSEEFAEGGGESLEIQKDRLLEILQTNRTP